MWSLIWRAGIKKTYQKGWIRLCHFESQESQGMQLIKSFDKSVDPYSKIHIQTPMHIKIYPVDLMKHPNGDWLTVSLMKKQTEGDQKKEPKFVVKQSQKGIDVLATGEPSSPDTVCIIHAPVRASFDIKATGNSDISIQDMHSDICELKSASGSVIMKNIRSKMIQVRNDEGNVECKGTLLADKVDIRTEASGDVTCQHMRALDLKIATNAGNISTESCYSDESQFTTVVGSLKLSNVHRNCLVEILKRGDLTMTGLDGTINAIIKRGNISLQASKLYAKSSIFVHESGLIDIKIPSDFKDSFAMELIANKLNIDEQILKHGKLLPDPQHEKFRLEDESVAIPENDLHVECRNGTVELKVSSWQEALEARGIKMDK